MESNRQIGLKELKSVFLGHSEEIQLSKDQLNVAYGLFKGSFVPELRDILEIVGSKGSDSVRFHSWETNLTLSLTIGFMKAKSPVDTDRITITDGGFTNIVFQLKEDIIKVEDSNVEEPVTLDTPESLLVQIPSSRKRPAGNTLGWVEKISEKLTEIRVDLEKTP